MPPSPTDFAIRAALDGDGAQLADLIRGVFAEYENCPFVPDEFPELAAPASHYAQRGGVLWIAERAGEVIGSLAVAPSWRAGEVELFKVYLARATRGQGIAGRMLELATEFARERGATRIVLWSDTKFVHGHRFYRRHGFLQLPGARALHDVAGTFEYHFTRDIPA